MTTADEIIRDMHACCKLMGWTFHSTEHFIYQALEFLCAWRYDGEDPKIDPNESGFWIAGDDAEGWVIRGNDFSGGGDTLADALCAAVFYVKDHEE